jgi:hypothetical protein
MKLILSLFMMTLFACVQNTPAPLGEACESQDDCASNLCANLNGGICTQLCDSVNPCPTNYECTPTAGVESVCIPKDMQNNTTAGTPAGTSAGVALAGVQGGTVAGSQGGTVAGSQGGAVAGSQGGSVAGSQGGSVAGSQGGSVAGSTTGTDLSCLEIIDCINQCPENNLQSCAQDCVSQGSIDGSNQVIAIFDCIQASNCAQGDQNCLQTQCANEFSACQDGTASNPQPSTADLDCKGFLICLSICQEDQACQNDCVNQATQEALQTYDAVATCYQNNQCQDEACLDMNCANEYQACVPSLNLSCTDALTCIINCDPNDEVCQYGCYLDAQDSAVTPLNDYLNCLNTQQCNSLDCAPCATQADACNTN